MSNTGWVVLGIAALVLLFMFKGGSVDFGNRESNPSSGEQPSGGSGSQGLLQDIVKGIGAAITLGGDILASNQKTT